MEQTVIEIERAVGVGRDYDVRPDDSWVGVFERAGALEVCDSYGARFQLPHPVRFPIVRAVGFDRVVVVDSRPSAGDPGGRVYSMAGEPMATLHVGDGVQDVVVLDDLITVTYFDEGVFSGMPPSEQGVAFFHLDGEPYGGYQTMFGAEAVDIADCYAACRVNAQVLAFVPYTGFELVRLNPRTHQQDVIDVPEKLHGASAISVMGDRVCLFGPYSQKQSLFVWTPGKAPQKIGTHSGTLRGIGPHRFISNGEHGYTVVSWAG